jgi:hypothetical protein
LVVWASSLNVGSGANLFGQRFNANGSVVGTEFQISSTLLNDPIIANLSATGLPDGGFVVTWESAFSTQINARRYDANSNGGSEFKVNTFFQTAVGKPVVTDLTDGGWVITYSSYDFDGSSYGIAGQRFGANGVKVGSEFVVNSYANGTQGDSQVTALVNGGFVVVWDSNPPGSTNDGVYGQLFSANGTKVGSEFVVSTNTDVFNGALPSITRLNDDGFLVTWRGLNPQRLFGQRFDAIGNKSGTEFQINAPAVSEYLNPAQISTLQDGRVVITWPGNSPSSPNGSILAKILTMSIKNDFGSDRKSDILWRNSNGDVALWEINGASIQGASIVSSVSNSWTINETADFNADGKADILWRDTSGAVAIWQMNGGAIQSSAIVGNVLNSWVIQDAADFNGDGKADILWRDTSGNVAIWQMNGTTLQSAAVVSVVANNWVIQDAGDFNGDGKADILWRDTTSGNVAIWQMNGTALQSAAVVGNAASNWVIKGIDDFNGDDKADILWRDTVSGNVAIWQMNGTTFQNGSIIGNADNTWSIAGTGDYNQDGTSDILWRNSNGSVATWEMNSGALGAGNLLSSVNSTWQIANA